MAKNILLIEIKLIVVTAKDRLGNLKSFARMCVLSKQRYLGILSVVCYLLTRRQRNSPLVSIPKCL